MARDVHSDHADTQRRVEAAATAFAQAPVGLYALEGEDLRYVALNGEGELFTPQRLGESALAAPFMSASGLSTVLRHVLETGERVTASQWRVSMPGPDGSLEEHYVDFSYAPLRQGNGTISGVIGYTLDVTESVRRRRAAREAAQGRRQRFLDTRDDIVRLQAALLPARLPVVPGIQLGARSLVGESPRSAGGDWLSAVPLPDGRLGLAVGDVVGHGVRACAVMGQLRAVLEEHLRAGDDPVQALTALNAFAATAPGAEAATVCLAIVDPTSGVVEYCTAGHPPPLRITGTDWSFLEPTGSTALVADARLSVRTAHLPDDGILVLYSDGLIERPGVARHQSTVEIGRVVTQASAHAWALTPGEHHHRVETLCEQSVDYLTRETGHDDDVTMLAIRRTARREPLALDVLSDEAGPTRLIAELEDWLRAVDASDDDVRDLGHALAELVTNSVEHGTPGRPDPIRLQLRAEQLPDGTARIVLVDSGTWRENPRASGPTVGDPRLRGLGLALASQLVDSLEVDRGPTGTGVTITRKLTRPTRGRAPAEPEVGPRPAPLDAELTVTGREPGRVTLRGQAVDRTVGVLRDVLDIESRAGTRDLTVDLAGVTRLAGAAVRVLHVALGKATRNGRRLRFLAPPDSVAAQVLRLSGITLDHAGAPS